MAYYTSLPSLGFQFDSEYLLKKRDNKCGCLKGQLPYHTLCENSSVGRAQPCQGWGREFESRFSLNKFLSRSSGGIGRHAGLKILWAFARAGSSPAPSTKTRVSVRARAVTRTLVFFFAPTLPLALPIHNL